MAWAQLVLPVAALSAKPGGIRPGGLVSCVVSVCIVQGLSRRLATPGCIWQPRLQLRGAGSADTSCQASRFLLAPAAPPNCSLKSVCHTVCWVKQMTRVADMEHCQCSHVAPAHVGHVLDHGDMPCPMGVTPTWQARSTSWTQAVIVTAPMAYTRWCVPPSGRGTERDKGA